MPAANSSADFTLLCTGSGGGGSSGGGRAGRRAEEDPATKGGAEAIRWQRDQADEAGRRAAVACVAEAGRRERWGGGRDCCSEGRWGDRWSLGNSGCEQREGVDPGE